MPNTTVMDTGADIITGENVGDLRYEVGASGGHIKGAIQVESVRDSLTQLHLQGRINEAEKRSIEARYGSEIETLRTEERLRFKLDEMDRRHSERFELLSRQIDNRFAEERERVMVAEVTSLKQDALTNDVVARLRTILGK